VKFLVTGLGNPGFDYINTRHNIGFKVLESIAESMSQDFEICRHGLISKIKYKGKTLILLKPNTFMNLSGKAVKYWLDKENILSQNCLIVTDDLALEFGKLRLRAKGSHAGHNGLKNISEILGNNIFPRLRFGIGNDFPKGYQTDYVLGKWDNNQLESIDENIKKAKEIIFSFCTIGIDMTMNNLN
jgi:PTH1 family peptidyl-tRNA hydrolase